MSGGDEECGRCCRIVSGSLVWVLGDVCVWGGGGGRDGVRGRGAL